MLATMPWVAHVLDDGQEVDDDVEHEDDEADDGQVEVAVVAHRRSAAAMSLALTFRYLNFFSSQTLRILTALRREKFEYLIRFTYGLPV